MENSFATIKDTSYSFKIQLSMPFHSYDFLIPMIFLPYGVNILIRIECGFHYLFCYKIYMQ
jgi:hypothetical protein